AADVRLNAWILAWVQHALLDHPLALYDANAFWPAPHTLVGSEHLLGLALQTLPARLISANAVTLYAVALWLSFCVTGLCSYALVWTVTRHRAASLLAAVGAMWMPWRFSEIAHIQLMSAGWFPLVWLLAARLWFSGRGEKIAGTAVVLALVATLQMLTSYYLAYFLLASAAVLAATWLALRRPPARAVAAVALALGLAALATALFALPYLGAASSGAVALKGTVANTTPPVQAWRNLMPGTRFSLDSSAGWNGAYRLPVALFALALATLFPRRNRRSGQAEAGSKRLYGPLAAGLWLVSAAAFILSLGRELHLGRLAVPLPAAALAAVVPGFANMRGPLRWQILIGTAVPILAGLGFARLAGRLAAVPTGGGGRPIRLLGSALNRIGLSHGSLRQTAGARPSRLPSASSGWVQPVIAIAALAAGASLLPPALPAVPALPRTAPSIAAYRVLANFPSGPVVEIPWPLQANTDGAYSSEYELASTLHWKPILNGYTAYTPRTYDFLRRMATGLPAREAVDRLVRLTAVRWIVVHVDLLRPAERESWRLASLQGHLVSAYADTHTAIYEIPSSPQSGKWISALLDPEPRKRTFSGLPRTRLEVPADGGRLEAIFPERLRLAGGWLKAAVAARITNRSGQPWPGLDIDPEGLVAVRYRIERPGGGVAAEGVSPIDTDVDPGATRNVWVTVQGRLEPGRYRLRLDLVQSFGGRPTPLAIEGVVGDIRIEGPETGIRRRAARDEKSEPAAGEPDASGILNPVGGPTS
ncbi:MAG: hypothetical protein D6760_13010, partial [Deltaproteobacteria bacterium]